MAANPCPCAPAHDRDCICPSRVRRRYLGRLSGPLLDRVDLRATLAPLTTLGYGAGEWSETTATVAARVRTARAAAEARWADLGLLTNAEVPGTVLRERFRLPRSVVAPLDNALNRGELTARGADRALRTAWTLADLAGRDGPDEVMVKAAIEFKEQRAT
jgi:magnesium chelatase family protein